MKTKLIRCLVKIKTEHGGIYRYVAIFPRTMDAAMDAHRRFHDRGSFSVTVMPMP